MLLSLVVPWTAGSSWPTCHWPQPVLSLQDDVGGGDRGRLVQHHVPSSQRPRLSEHRVRSARWGLPPCAFLPQLRQASRQHERLSASQASRAWSYLLTLVTGKSPISFLLWCHMLKIWTKQFRIRRIRAIHFLCSVLTPFVCYQNLVDIKSYFNMSVKWWSTGKKMDS